MVFSTQGKPLWFISNINCNPPEYYKIIWNNQMSYLVKNKRSRGKKNEQWKDLLSCQVVYTGLGLVYKSLTHISGGLKKKFSHWPSFQTHCI